MKLLGGSDSEDSDDEKPGTSSAGTVNVNTTRITEVAGLPTPSSGSSAEVDELLKEPSPTSSTSSTTPAWRRRSQRSQVDFPERD